MVCSCGEGEKMVSELLLQDRIAVAGIRALQSGQSAIRN
jgi:hypothetical protein